MIPENNNTYYSPGLLDDGEIVGVVGSGDSGPPCYVGVGFKSKGEWVVQWYEPSNAHGFQPLEFYKKAMGEPRVIGFTPLLPGFGMTIREEA